MPRPLLSLSTEEAGALARRGALVAVPFGSLEQHCRAPLGADTIIVEAVARRACSIFEARTGSVCVIHPTIPVGYSPEWSRASGTVSLSAATMLRLVEEIVESLYTSGFTRIALLNGHGGNSGLLEAAARGVASRHESLIVGVIDYWRPAGLRLGHCDRAEESLLSEAIGGPVRCGCIHKSKPAEHARVISIPRSTALRGLEGGSQPLGFDEVARRVALALEELYRAPEGDLLL